MRASVEAGKRWIAPPSAFLRWNDRQRSNSAFRRYASWPRARERRTEAELCVHVARETDVDRCEIARMLRLVFHARADVPSPRVETEALISRCSRLDSVSLMLSRNLQTSGIFLALTGWRKRAIPLIRCLRSAPTRAPTVSASPSALSPTRKETASCAVGRHFR